MNGVDETPQWGIGEQIAQAAVSLVLLILLVGFWAWLWVRPV